VFDLADQQKGRIFISYRRADSAGYAGRIYDRLTAHFGEDAVFMDVDTIEAGVDFVEVLQNAVQRCDVLVALIGRRWLDSKDANGKRRLDNPEDFVRIEVAAALDRDIRVIPVLVDGVIMPNSTELPGNLKPLARCNALQVDHQSFNLDVQRLISQLELALKAAERAKAEKLRLDQEALEKKAADEKRVRETATKAAREKEERDRKEREERAQQEVESREKAEVEERVRKTALYKERQRENIEPLRSFLLEHGSFHSLWLVGLPCFFCLVISSAILSFQWNLNQRKFPFLLRQ
jgi:flagellar biosynthesis GTPase FlhF